MTQGKALFILKFSFSNGFNGLRLVVAVSSFYYLHYLWQCLAHGLLINVDYIGLISHILFFIGFRISSSTLHINS